MKIITKSQIQNYLENQSILGKVNFVYSNGDTVHKGILKEIEVFGKKYIALFHNFEYRNGGGPEDGVYPTGFSYSWIFKNDYDFHGFEIFTGRRILPKYDEVVDGYVEVSEEGREFISNADDCDIVKSYHTKLPLIFHRREKETLKRTDFFGIELEYHAIGDSSSIRKWMGKNQGFFHYERDGSLDYGVETISQPFSELYYHARGRDKIAEFVKLIPSTHDGNKTVDNGSGLHIHISRASLREELVCKLYFFLNNPEWRDQIKKIAGRDSARWASPKDECKKRKFDQCKKENGGRYVSLNLENANTVEIRIFKSSTLVWKVLGRIEFVLCLINYLRLSEGRYWNGVTFDKFVEFASDRDNEYTNLFKLLVSTGIVGEIQTIEEDIEG